jgi:type IV secretion system protein VirD4
LKVKIRIGLQKDGSPLHYNSDGHICLTAPTRSGKTRDLLAAIGLTFRGSLIVIDPKAQLAAITKRRREQFGRVVMLNPFELFRPRLGPSDRFNPLSILDPASPGFVADCDGIAEGFITRDLKDAHWTDSARQLYSGGIMHLMTSASYAAHEKTLSFLYDQLSRSPLEFARQAIATGTDLVKQRLTRFAQAKAYESTEIPSIISTANTQTAFLGIEAIAQNLSGSDLDFRSLKAEPTTVYLTLPTEYMEAAGKWFRLVIAAALKVLLREPEDGEDTPILAILDEFANCIGQLSIMEKAMSMAAGYGLQLMPVLQDLSQLQKHYPESWESFLANSEAQVYFAPRDQTSADYISKLAGEKEVVVRDASLGDHKTERGIPIPDSGLSVSFKHEVVPELRLHDALRLPGDKFFCFMDGVMFEHARAPYFEQREFKGMYDPDPYYRPRKI